MFTVIDLAMGGIAITAYSSRSAAHHFVRMFGADGCDSSHLRIILT